MTGMTLPSQPTVSAEDYAAIQAFHRGTRNAGYVFCLIGVLVMISGRYMPGAPGWLVALGVAIIVFGWGLLAYATVKRLGKARALAARRSG
jgi:hypothetical protein